ncbi:MAG: hypothetical protein FJW86_07940 [Actinobacteria bacterium]|nr:hypothetical protein [Actinomycetota bacterium]
MPCRRTPLVALVISCLLLTGALVTPSGAAVAAGAESQVTLFPVWVAETPDGSVGGANPVRIRLRSSGGDEFRVGFTEDEVAGTGDQWRAAGWNAATVATLLTGAPLGGNEITFDLYGRIDGPSAGGLMTVGTIALLRGDKVKKDITMTGTINPDGTIGPVGGIPYKVDGVVEVGKTRMLIPLGQRNSTDDLGNLVDVVDYGQSVGVEVIEVADIYEAYELFTGEQLRRPSAGGGMQLSPDAYDTLEGFVEAWLSDFDASVSQWDVLDPEVQEIFLEGLAAEANTAQERAFSLSQQGLQAGAYSSALEAAAFARAAVVSGTAAQIYFTQGIDAFVAQISASASVEDDVDALIEELKTLRPRTLGQVSTLIDAYGYAFDAYAVSQFAQDQFATADELYQSGDVEGSLDPAIIGAQFYSIVGTQVDAAYQLLNLGSGGARLKNEVDPSAAADFFRKAAEANMQAFDTIIVESKAEDLGVSSDQVRAFLYEQDFDYTLAQAGFNLVEDQRLEEVLGGGRNAAFGDLGGSIALYVRANGLINKYYALIRADCLDETFEPVCVQNERALASALDFAEGQVEGGVGILLERNVDPTNEVGAYEVAGIDREGDIADKLDALEGYLAAFIKARVLAYLGGFETAGLE